jgi:hypothetical protein
MLVPVGYLESSNDCFSEDHKLGTHISGNKKAPVLMVLYDLLTAKE